MTDHPHAPEPDKAPGGQPAGEAPDDGKGTFVLGVLALVMGLLLLLAAGLLFFAFGRGTGLAEGAADGPRYAFGAGVGLFVLGVMLLGGRVVDFFRQRRSFQAANSLLMSALGLMLLVIVNFLAARHDFWRLDLTSEGLYTLSEESAGLVGRLERPLRLVLLQSHAGAQDVEATDALLAQYAAASPQVRVERVELRGLEQSRLQALLADLGIEAARHMDEVLGVVVQTGVDTAEGWRKAESKHIPSTELWEQDLGSPGGKRTFLGEQKISSAIREVTDGDKPKLYFVTGHDEASIDDHGEKEGLSKLATLLRQKGYDAPTVNLFEAREVPADADLLVIAAPRRPFTAVEVAAVTAYLERGGDAVLLLEPVLDRRPGGGTRFAATGLERVLAERYGVEVEDRQLYAQFREPILQRTVVTEQLEADGFDLNHRVTAPLSKQQGRVLLTGARSLATKAVDGATTTELLKVGRLAQAVFSTGDPLGLQDAQRAPADARKGDHLLAVASERTVEVPAPHLAKLRRFTELCSG